MLVLIHVLLPLIYIREFLQIIFGKLILWLKIAISSVMFNPTHLAIHYVFSKHLFYICFYFSSDWLRWIYCCFPWEYRMVRRTCLLCIHHFPWIYRYGSSSLYRFSPDCLSALPYLYRTHYFLYPITFGFIFYVATVTACWNISRTAFYIYHVRVENPPHWSTLWLLLTSIVWPVEWHLDSYPPLCICDMIPIRVWYSFLLRIPFHSYSIPFIPTDNECYLVYLLMQISIFRITVIITSLTQLRVICDIAAIV